MDQIIDVEAIVQREVEDYAISGATKHVYMVIVMPDYPRVFPTGVVVMARVVEGMVIIDEDITDCPLVEELVRAGIPRDKIIALYAGEQLPAET